MTISTTTRIRRRGLGLALSLAVLVLFWACGDKNLFGPGPSAPPEVVNIQLPGEVFSGQVLDVRARVVGNVPIDSVSVRVRGAFAGDQSVTAPAGKVDFTFDASFPVPEEVDDTTAVVEVVATDVRGNTSSVATGTVRITDTAPPSVSLSVEASQVALGNSFEVQVTSSDNVGLREVGVRAFFTEGDTLLTETVAVSERSDERTFQIQVPSSAPEGELMVEAFAVDQDGNEAVSPQSSQVQVVFVDEERPAVAVSLPNVSGEVGIGIPLIVEAEFSDNGGVTDVTYEGLGLRGDVDLGTDSTVARFESTTATFSEPVSDSTVKRLLASIPADSTEEDVHIVVTATDAQGNVGADTTTVTVKPDFNAPAIAINQPASGSGLPITDSVLVDLTVEDPTETLTTGVSTVLLEGVSFVGDRDLGTFEVVDRYESKEVTFDPPATGATDVTRFLVPTGDTTATQAFIRVTATDAWGNQIKDSVQVQLGAPSVRFVSPADGEAVSPGSPMTVEVEANDPAGVASIEVTKGGDLASALSGFPLTASFSPAEDTASLSQTITVPNQTGTFTISATAVNSNGIEGSVGPITIEVVSQQTTDDEPPELRVSYRPSGSPTDGRRLESTDEVIFSVEGSDNSGGSGVSLVGVTIPSISRARGDSVTFTSTVTVNPAQSGTFTTDFSVPVSQFETLGVLDLVEAADTVDLEIFAFMEDAQGNCAAATSSDTFQSLDCATLNGNTFASGFSGQTDFMVGVTGQTVGLPSGGRIADAAVDTAQDLLFLSNVERDRLEVFDLDARAFEPSILVGAEPWGMTFSRFNSDTLYVANSAGTNLSVVDVVGRREDLSRRILTPNTVLFEVSETVNDQGEVALSSEFFDFSDRPQFVAQDGNGSLLYGTEPTEDAPDGTIRLGIVGQGAGDTEVVLYTEHTELLAAEDVTAFGNVDDIEIEADFSTGDDGMFVLDHRVGDLDDVVQTDTVVDPGVALDAIKDSTNVFAEGGSGTWDLEDIGLSDTTFVAASGDGSLIAIGEGATASSGRVILYRTPTLPPTPEPEDFIGTVSGETQVVDLVGNASERVLGLAMNHDGTLGAARGLFEVYFFTPNLRLQGSSDVSPGGAGVALHPFHIDGPTDTDPNVSFAFAGTGDRTIEVFDTRHFTRIGRAFIREKIVGQIRAVIPEDSDQPSGFPSCTDSGEEVTIGTLGNAKKVFDDPDGLDINEGLADECVVVKLTGVTGDGGVVVVDVTKADIVRDHPDN